MDSLFFWYHNFGIYYFPNRGGGVINSTCLEPFVSAETLCRVNNAWSGEKKSHGGNFMWYHSATYGSVLNSFNRSYGMDRYLGLL